MLRCEEYVKIEKIALEEQKCSDWNIRPRFCFFQQWKEEEKVRKNTTIGFGTRSIKSTVLFLSSCLSLVQKILIGWYK